MKYIKKLPNEIGVFFPELSIVRDSPSLVFSRDSKTDAEWKSFTVQKEGLRYAPD